MLCKGTSWKSSLGFSGSRFRNSPQISQGFEKRIIHLLDGFITYPEGLIGVGNTQYFKGGELGWLNIEVGMVKCNVHPCVDAHQKGADDDLDQSAHLGWFLLKG